MKFNVDGAGRGGLRVVRIGGTLWDDYGNIKILFSKSVGTMDSNLAEIYTIKEAFILFTASS